jgi:hypothetical protein
MCRVKEQGKEWILRFFFGKVEVQAAVRPSSIVLAVDCDWNTVSMPIARGGRMDLKDGTLEVCLVIRYQSSRRDLLQPRVYRP